MVNNGGRTHDNQVVFIIYPGGTFNRGFIFLPPKLRVKWEGKELPTSFALQI